MTKYNPLRYCRNKKENLVPSVMYHFDRQELLILSLLSMDRLSFRQPLLRFLPNDHESSP